MTTSKTAKTAVDFSTLKLNAEATKIASAIGKALDKQAAGSADLLKAVLAAGVKVSDDQLRAAVVQTYVNRGNALGTAKIRASEAVKIRASAKELKPLVDDESIVGFQAAARAAGNLAKGDAWDKKAPSKAARKGSGPKTPDGTKAEPAQAGTAVPENVTKAIAEQSLRDHVNRLKAKAKDQAAADWLGKVVDMIDLIG